MLSKRLSLALESGAFTLPATGRIAVVGPASDADLSALPKDRVEIVHRRFPEHWHFSRSGFVTRTDFGSDYAAAIVCLPRAKSEARHVIATVSAATRGAIVIDGQKTDGIDSLLKSIRSRARVHGVISKGHGKLVVITGGQFPDWLEEGTDVLAARRFRTVHGGFSADGVDPASSALAAALPEDLAGSVVDLGAGWGYLADAVLRSPHVTRVDLVEADHAALEAARDNIRDDRARFHWADALDWRPEAPADHVVANPPFHLGRAAKPALGQEFIRAAATMLAPRGQLWLVANRHLPYERTLREVFRSVDPLGDQGGFKLFRASTPRRRRG